MTSLRSSRAALLRPLDDAGDAPALLFAQRAAVDDLDRVAHVGVIVLVVRLEPARAPDGSPIERMSHAALDRDDDGLVHLVAHDLALARRSRAPVGLGCHQSAP